MSQSIDFLQQQEFKRLQVEGKQLAAEGRLKESLQKFELAKNICATEKVLKRIEKLKECLRNVEKESLSKDESECMSEELSSKGSGKISPNLNNVDKTAFVAPKILNDIQNVQNLSTSRSSTRSTDLSPISQSKFTELKKLAKEAAYDGNHEKALEYFKKALSIKDCPNVKRYIQEIKLVMSNSSENVLNTQDASIERIKEPSIHEASEKNPSTESLEADKSDLDKKLAKIKNLYEEARELAADGKLTNALQALEKAQSIHETNKVQKRIDKIKELISADLHDSDSNDMIKITEDFSVFHEIYNKLYPYQREGVAWMWKLYKMRKGGVLGDDMGLGKTFQVIAFLSGMIDADLVKHVLIIMPVSLLQNWSKEFKKWCPGIIVHDFHGGSKKERERNLLRIQKRGHVLLTSYGMVVNNVNTLIDMEGREFVWDYLILDEGHKIKNPTKTTKAVYEIPSKNRLVLTGTPIQNNLRELWSLYDFVQQGTLLGSLKTFKLQYENSITRSREKDATAGEKRLGTEMAENLKSLIKPYFLRRTKDEIWKKKTDDDVEQLGSQMEKMTITRLNAKKNDLILWTYMSDPQIEIYNSFLHSDAVKSILVSKRSPLVELTTLKKICDHPRLLSQRACLQLGLNGDLQVEDLERELEDESNMTSSIDNVSDDTLLHESGKLKLVLQLLENLKETGHRTLVFSLSRKILDMIHRILVNRKWKVMRLDGTVAKTEERERRIQRFQNDPSYPVFLLTTQVGGVGITLTAADRVIIYDPSWNPATDAQAVDRVYRIGQEKNVVVYRLITCGSVEEKIYRRQIFKDSITRQATGVADPYRYFSKQELRELFTLDNPHYSATQVQLSEMHSSERLTDNFLERHIHYLQSLNIFGISDHDLMFSKNIQDNSEDNDKAAISEEFIKKQVATAHELIKMEASVVAEGMRLACSYNRPYQEMIPLQKKASVKDTYKPPVLPDVIDLTENAVDVFPSPKYRKSQSPDKIHSPGSIYQGSLLDIKQYSSPTQVKSDRIFPLDEQENVSPKNIIPHFKNDELIEPDVLNTSCIEKFRKSLHYPKPFAGVRDSIEILSDENVCDVNTENNNMNSVEKLSDVKDNGCRRENKNVLEESEHGQLIEKLQNTYEGLKDVLDNDLQDTSIDLELPERSMKSSRRSCARRSTFMISDSESSHHSSTESNLNATIGFVEDSEDVISATCDSLNSASVSFVPDSSPNTPETVKLPKANHFVSETPPKVFSFEPKLLTENFSLESDNSCLRKLEGSVRRITPLKVDKDQTPQNSSFVQAMAASVVLTPYNSPERNDYTLTPSVSPKSFVDCSLENSHNEISLNEDDSPVKFIKKKKPQQLCSDSEESDGEMENVTNLSLVSTTEHEKKNFENEISSGSLSTEDLENNSCDSESAIPNDCNSDDEHCNLSGGDRNFKHLSESVEDSGESVSENSNSSEDESDYDFENQSSNESGSVFSEDEDNDSESDKD